MTLLSLARQFFFHRFIYNLVKTLQTFLFSTFFLFDDNKKTKNIEWHFADIINTHSKLASTIAVIDLVIFCLLIQIDLVSLHCIDKIDYFK